MHPDRRATRKVGRSILRASSETAFHRRREEKPGAAGILREKNEKQIGLSLKVPTSYFPTGRLRSSRATA